MGAAARAAESTLTAPPPPGWSALTEPLDSILAKLSSAQLIDRLLDETNGEPNQASPVSLTGFLPLHAPENPFSGEPLPRKSPVMTEVVRRGVEVIPFLLEHLSDARPTHVILDPKKLHLNGNSGAYTADYDFRSHENWPQFAGVNLKSNQSGTKGDWPYTVKVGDLCFVALGQIVNRRLYVSGPDFGNGMMFSGAFSLSINSPVETPALAAAARADWSGITPAQLAEALKHDALTLADPNAKRIDGVWHPPLDPLGSLTRLLVYFPRMGSEVMETLLRRPLVHWALPATALPRDQPQTTSADLTGVIARLEAFQWDGLDASVFALYRRAVDEENKVIAARPPSGRLASTGYDLPLACAKRLLHKGHDDEFRIFFAAAVELARAEYSAVLEKMKDDIVKEPSPFGSTPNPALAEADRHRREFQIQSMSAMLLAPIAVRAEFLKTLGSTPR
ncbi:MAG: hypothetical protein ABIO94_08780 [Opitutaceae bacterium]